MNIDFSVRRVLNGYVVSWYNLNEYGTASEFIALTKDELKAKLAELLDTPEPTVQAAADGDLIPF